MHDAIAAFLEQTKEAGKHRRGLLLGIVEQHNSATIGFDPLNDKMVRASFFLLGRNALCTRSSPLR